MKEDVKYTEDLLREEDINIDALLKSKWRHPIRTWCRYKLFLIQIYIVDLILDLKFLAFKSFINKWKK